MLTQKLTQNRDQSVKKNNSRAVKSRGRLVVPLKAKSQIFQSLLVPSKAAHLFLVVQAQVGAKDEPVTVQHPVKLAKILLSQVMRTTLSLFKLEKRLRKLLLPSVGKQPFLTKSRLTLAQVAKEVVIASCQREVETQVLRPYGKGCQKTFFLPRKIFKI